MKPTDKTLGTFEQKVREAGELTGFTNLTDAEVAKVKDRIRFVLFESNPADLTVAQIGDWLRRMIPGIRRSTAIVAAHSDLADRLPVTADLLPSSLRNKIGVQADGESLAAGEVLCTLMSDRLVKFNSANMVVTPMRINNEEG